MNVSGSGKVVVIGNAILKNVSGFGVVVVVVVMVSGESLRFWQNRCY